tara:strand:+ start:61 stop:612 length:552 start_codon:yes stop_codon:yes gene_type:complete
MANTTFTGPVRSESTVKVSTKNTTTGAHTDKVVVGTNSTGDTSSNTAGSVELKAASTNTMTLQTYQATITVADGATTGKEASIGMPANFAPLAIGVNVTTASSNAVNLQDVGDDADTDSYLDGASIAVNSTGFKGIFGCNGVRGIGTGTTGATGTADEVEVVLSGDPGGDTVIRLTFIGILGA